MADINCENLLQKQQLFCLIRSELRTKNFKDSKMFILSWKWKVRILILKLIKILLPRAG